MSDQQSKPQMRFASGEITCTAAALAAIRETGATALALLCRHLTGDGGSISEEQIALNRQAIETRSDLADIVSRYRLASGVEIVITTTYPATPSLRWTDICLAEEVITADDEDDDSLDLLVEAAFIITEETEAPEMVLEGAG
ncbi:MAG: hypothetical protein JXM69_17950 [Anaerolineae bacterium]|nr:hypothetical protein [Anaerolineae bacterium]